MPRGRRPSEREQHLTIAADHMARIQRDHLKVVGRLRDWSAGIGGTGGPQPKNSISDPTGQTALAVDEFGTARNRLEALIDEVCRRLDRIEVIRREVMAPPPTLEEVERERTNQRADGLQPCANQHGCPDEGWATKAGRCETCYKYRARNGQDRRVSRRTNDGGGTDE